MDGGQGDLHAGLVGLLVEAGNLDQRRAADLLIDARDQQPLALAQFQQARGRLDAQEGLATGLRAEESVFADEQRLQAVQSKFDVGMATNFEVVQAQRDLNDARNSELRQQLNYQRALVDFQRVQISPR